MTYDHVIVGGGTAGCLVANRLSQDEGRTVLLLEAGGSDRRPDVERLAAWPTLLGSDADWGYRTEEGQMWPRGKVLGGSSSINLGNYHEGQPADYDAWGDGWRWSDVQPVFAELRRELTIQEHASPLPISQAFVAAAREQGLRASLTSVMMRDGQRVSSAAAFLHPVQTRPNLHVRTSTMVERIVLEDGQAVGVRVNGEVLRSTRDVVVCGGSIETPRLLLRSGIDAAGVGENLQDHAHAAVAWRALQPWDLSASANLGEAWAHGDGMQIYFAPLLMGPGAPPGFTLLPMLTRPRTRGRVTQDRLYAGDPGEDVAALTDVVRLARRIAASPHLEPYRAEELVPGSVALEEYVPQHLGSIFHQVGTCAIGTVVDEQLRVRGVRNLRIADGSVMPRIISGATAAACMMIGARAARWLLA